MNIRICSFTILLAALFSQGNLFASEDDFNKPQGPAQLIDANKWGEPNNGLVTQLIPRSVEYVVGKPMKFGLVLKNIIGSVKQYNNWAVYSKPLRIKTPDNNCPYDKKGPFSTQAGMLQPIDVNEIITLFEDLDVTDQYLIIKPGKYTVQFCSIDPPASNVIEFDVKPGKPTEQDLLVSLMLNILPDASWRVTAPPRRNDSIEQKEESIAVVLSRGGKIDHIGVMLWQTKIQGAINDRRQNPPEYEYLGKNESGYFYVSIPTKALDYWPKIKEDISKVLKLES
jgi:hypothetical protein